MGMRTWEGHPELGGNFCLNESVSVRGISQQVKGLVLESVVTLQFLVGGKPNSRKYRRKLVIKILHTTRGSHRGPPPSPPSSSFVSPMSVASSSQPLHHGMPAKLYVGCRIIVVPLTPQPHLQNASFPPCCVVLHTACLSSGAVAALVGRF